MKINQTQQTLLGVLSQALSGIEYTIPEDTDWAALYTESRAQAVMPIVFTAVAGKCTDAEVRMKWKAVTIRSMQKNRQIQVCHRYVHQVMTEHNIPYTIIKGCASANDYPDPLMRAMGDVDFLVPMEYWEQAVELLKSEGFTAEGENHSFHVGFTKEGFPSEMEMHHDPFGFTKLSLPGLKEIIPEAVEKSVEVTCGDITFRMPDPFCHGTVLLLHAYRHLLYTGIGVRHLCDWAMFIRNFDEDEFIRIFKRRYEALGIWKLTQIFSATAHRYLGIPYQKWMAKPEREECEMLMLDILNGGNFGQGSGERETQNRSLYSGNRELTEGSNKLQMLRSLNKAALEHYPRMMKIKIFRPFGWIFVCFRYAFRVLTGKRQKVPKGTMKMVAMRRKLYEQLEVFKTE